MRGRIHDQYCHMGMWGRMGQSPLRYQPLDTMGERPFSRAPLSPDY